MDPTNRKSAIVRTIVRPDAELIRRVARFSAATLAEATQRRSDLPAAIKPLTPDMRVCGPAITVLSPAGDNLMLHQAIYCAEPGDVLVAKISRSYEAGYWGEIMTYAAIHRKIAGLVIDGWVRDAAVIEQMAFPVFARGLCVHGTAKRGGGSVNKVITVGAVRIRPGDLVLADRDGVVVVPQSELTLVLARAAEREKKENSVKKQLASGRTTVDLYGW